MAATDKGGGVLFDHGRCGRIGLPEAVFCQGKDDAALLSLLQRFAAPDASPMLFTRLEPERFAALPEELRRAYDYHRLSRTALSGRLAAQAGPAVGVISAGTADAPVAWEAQRTLEYLGIENRIYEDCGVAGLWRLMGRLDELRSLAAIIVVAGLDGALPSVLGGLIGCPLFALPTSVGYGVARGGRPALDAMLASCSPGLAVLNIDNGYGAACAAARVIRQLRMATP